MKRLFILLLLPVFAAAQNKQAKQIIEVSGYDTIHQVTVTSQLGQTVYSQDYNKQEVEVIVGGQPAGFYIVTINGSDHRQAVNYNEGMLNFVVRVSNGIIMRCTPPFYKIN